MSGEHVRRQHRNDAWDKTPRERQSVGGLILMSQWALIEDVGGAQNDARPPVLLTDSYGNGSAGVCLLGCVCARRLQSGSLYVARVASCASGDHVAEGGGAGAAAGATPSCSSADEGWSNMPLPPLSTTNSVVLGAPERPDREDLPKYDRVVLVDVSSDGKLIISQEDGIVARLQLGGVAWLRSEFNSIPLEPRMLQQEEPQDDEDSVSVEGAEANAAAAAEASAAAATVGYRRDGNLVFCEGVLPAFPYVQTEDTVVAVFPPHVRSSSGRRCFLAVVPVDQVIHMVRIDMEPVSGRLLARRGHAQGRARDGHIFEVSKKNPGALKVSLGTVRFVVGGGAPLELLAGARAPRQFAARKRLAYLGLGSQEDQDSETLDELDGFQIPGFARRGCTVVLDGAIILTTRHRYTAFASLPPECWPPQNVTLMVARALPLGRLVPERLDVTTDGKCLCPQLPPEMGVDHIIHLSGATYGCSLPSPHGDTELGSTREDSSTADAPHVDHAWEAASATGAGANGLAEADAAGGTAKAPERDRLQPSAGGYGGGRSGGGAHTETPAWTRLKELEQTDRRFRGKFRNGAEFLEFGKYLQWFRAHDCTESHRLTHSCFKGRSDFTQTGMLVFDTEEDLEGLNKAIAWLYERRVPVVLMERQTRIFPMIFDIDLKCTREDILANVPQRIKNAKPWRGQVDFCRWPSADFLVLTEDLLLLRHLGKIIFQFYPDLPLIDLCIFNASGWDRVKETMKVSLHIVAPYVLVSPERLTAIRERMLEYLGEASEHRGHPMQKLIEEYLSESPDNTWDKVVDQTVTSGTNGLRMPFCDKAQRMLKREFQRRKDAGEVFTERELAARHAYVREEAGRPCLPEGIVRLLPPPPEASEWAVCEAKWMCRGADKPIEEWIRLGRCRYTWRLPLSLGQTPWRPPLRFQWAEPARLWEDRADLKGSPVVRRFSGSGAEFRENFDEAARRLSSRLHGGWLNTNTGARWRGGLKEEACHEVRFIQRADRVVLLLAPEAGAARAFAELRRVLADWTEADDELCVPLFGNLTDSHSAALHTVDTPSEEFPDVHEALEAVPADEPMHRIFVRAGVHVLKQTLVLRGPVLLEGEGRWDTVLRANGFPVLRFEGTSAGAPMARNLNLELVDEDDAATQEDGSTTTDGGAAVEMCLADGVATGEPALVGCVVSATGRWGTCVHGIGGAPQVVRNRFSCARWGAVFVKVDGRIEDNEFLGLGESGLVLIGGGTWVHRNRIHDCGGVGIIAGADCHAVIEANEVKDCLSGLRIVGKRVGVELRCSGNAVNRLVHNGLCDEHQLEAPPGVVPSGATATVRSCRPYPSLPADEGELRRRLAQCEDRSELAVLVRAARRRNLWREASFAHRRLVKLVAAQAKEKVPAGQQRKSLTIGPAPCETGVVCRTWEGPASGYGANSITVKLGSLCEIWRRHTSGWLLVSTSDGQRGWVSPHVLS
eukprot:TRINITY_DN74219_c0_g1_i1.p1 TRINITY_DN74219_c0_g1~~TRINITY_DN74219_c0_g1_i1.p1  ORF type:complete len:1476 (-),score=281.90 TRINITY_DN74219_c0_g1_i1:36-4415(-)